MAGVEVCRTYLKPRSCRPEPPHHGATPILLVLEKEKKLLVQEVKLSGSV